MHFQIYQIQEKYGRTSKRKRDEAIVANIERALRKIESGKVLIVFGIDHKYFIDDFLRSRHPRELSPPIQKWFKKNEMSVIQRNVIERAKSNLRSSSELLESRLQSDFYSPLMKEQLGQKVQYLRDCLGLYDSAFAD